MEPLRQQFSHYPALPAPVKLPLQVLPEHPCVYLPGRVARMRGFAVGKMPGEMYHAFMDAGFRRSGRLVYQPICAGCRECVPIRLAVNEFQPSKSQRRCARKNADLSVEIGAPVATDEKFELYCRYLRDRHGGEIEGREAFERFLYESPVQTVEFIYRSGGGKLVAVGICDVCDQSVSSVYFYFDPTESRRGLGTYGVLREVDYTRLRNIPHYYLGYWVRRCRSMQYKAEIGVGELLRDDGVWLR